MHMKTVIGYSPLHSAASLTVLTVSDIIHITPPAVGVASYGAPGHVPPWISNCLIFLVTSEPHKL